MRVALMALAVAGIGLFAAGQAAPTASAPARRAAAFIPSAVDGGKYAVEANLPYDAHPGTILDVMYPKGMVKNDPSGKKYPGVVMFHGGGWIRTSKSTMSTFYNRFLDHGFVVCNVEYRMADATGEFSPEAANAPVAVEDALKGAKWFWDHADEYNMNKSRYVVTGASAGGHLALMVGMATPEAKLGPTSPVDFKIAAIVNGYGPPDVVDLLNRGTSWAKQWLPESTPERMALAKRLSPLTYARKEMPPLLTVQGSNDRTVPVEQNQNLVKVLKEKGGVADIYLAEGAGHGFTNPTWPGVEHEIFDLFLPKVGIIKAK